MTKLASPVVALLLLAGAALAVHGPGVTTAPEFDQTQYFLERQEWPSFVEALKRLDYSLARRYWKGDEGEFRPLLFLWLAVQYSLFGADMRGWHAANIGLHIVVAFLLYRLLRLRHTAGMSLLLSGLFAVLTTSVGLVLEPYVGGYLCAYALVLVAIRSAWGQLDQADRIRLSAWMPYALALTVACFFFEVLVPLSLVLAAYILLETRRRGLQRPRWFAAVLLLPVLVYGAAYVPHIFSAPRLLFIHGVPGTHLLAAENFWIFPPNLAFLVTRWAGLVTMPTVRLSLTQPLFDNHPAEDILRTIAVATNAGLVVACLMMLVRRRPRAGDTDARWRLAALAALLIGYAAVVSFVRGVTDDTFSYFVGLFGVLLVSALAELSGLMGRARLGFMGLLVALGLLNAGLSAGFTARNGREGAEYVRPLAALDRFVRAHRYEPGFSFTLQEGSQEIAEEGLGRPISVVEGYPDMPIRASERPAWRIFHGAAPDAADAAYSVRWTGTALLVEPRGARKPTP